MMQSEVGMQQAPLQIPFNALGMTEEEMKKPMVGIVSSYNEIVPGHMNIDKIVEAVKLGVVMAGGNPGGVPGYRGLRRNRHGAYRHEVFLGDHDPI